jgi:hypothetical protein
MTAKSNVRLVNTEPRSAEREALAAVIGRYTGAVEEVARVQSAIVHAEETAFAVRDTLITAEAALAEAKANEGNRLAAIALGESCGASVEDAEVAVTKAQNDLNATRATRDALQARLERADNTALYTRMALDDAIRDVLKAETPIERLLSEFRALHETFIAHRRALEWLEGQGAMPKNIFWRNAQREWSDAGEAPWKAAVAALKVDADAPLPA